MKNKREKEKELIEEISSEIERLLSLLPSLQINPG